MSRKFLAFDIETAKQIPGDFSDWRKYRPLGICCAATVTGDTDEKTVWHGTNEGGRPSARMSEGDLAEMVSYLSKMSRDGYEIVTWNGLQFDFDVLAEESKLFSECSRLARQHVDMMFQVVCQLGYMLSLDAAAKGMGISGKLDGMSGQLVPEMWERGEHEKVLEYVEQDARSTLELAEAIEKAGCLRWISRRGKRCDMRLLNGWLTVEEAMKLALPDTSWMTDPVERSSFVDWMGLKVKE